MATYAIGDIQGCFHSLQNLLAKCHFDPHCDRLWFVGDLVNRGPRSLETLRFVKALGASAITVLGNHDLALLIVAEGFRASGRGDTWQDVLSAPDRDELLHWLRHRPLCHYEKRHLLVHAGLLPSWTVKDALHLGKEVEKKLQGRHHRRFLEHLWGNEPNIWRKSLKDAPRTRVIVNAMTRMRFCSAQGRMELASKGESTHAPQGFMPWFLTPRRQSANTTLVVGHWSALGLVMEDRLIALDTGCLWGGELSAVRLEDRALFQVPCVADEKWQGGF